MPTDHRFRRLLLFLPAVCVGAHTVMACEILVRDAAFRIPRDMYRLCVIADSDDPAADETVARLTGWLDEDAAELNVDLVRVLSDDPEVRWSDYGIPSAPPSLPVTVLVGTNREIGLNFYIQHWEPEPTAEQLLELADSPLRQRLQQELGRQLAVVLYAPCEDCEDDRVPAMLDLLDREWQNVQGTELGVSVIEVDRNDPAERLLLSLAGIAPGGPDWVGVVFGRGKLMNPPLIDQEITPAALNGLLEQVLADCSCSKPLPSMGVDLPIVWTAVLDDQVIPLGTPAESSEPDSIMLAGLVSTPDGNNADPPAIAAEGGFDLYVHDTYVPLPRPSTMFKWVLGILSVAIIVVGVMSWWLLRKKVE